MLASVMQSCKQADSHLHTASPLASPSTTTSAGQHSYSRRFNAKFLFHRSQTGRDQCQASHLCSSAFARMCSEADVLRGRNAFCACNAPVKDPCRDPVPGDRVPCDRVPGDRDPAGPAVKLREAASDERALPPPASPPLGMASRDLVRGLAAPIFLEYASIDLHMYTLVRMG